MTTIRIRDLRRLGRDLHDVAKATDAATTATYLGGVARSLPAIARSRSLVPADERMTGRQWPFRIACGQIPVQLKVDGSTFAGAREMYARRVYFPATVPRMTIPAGGAVVDLGANHGMFTRMAAHIASRVLAVEAQSGFIPVIEAAVRTGGGRAEVSVEHAIVGATVGIVADPDWVTRASHYERPPTVVDLGALLDSRGFNTVDFLKVDIEGSEFALFNDSAGWLPRVARIAMEIHTRFGDQHGLRALLDRAGFETRLADNELRPTPAIEGLSGYLYAWRPQSR